MHRSFVKKKLSGYLFVYYDYVKSVMCSVYVQRSILLKRSGILGIDLPHHFYALLYGLVLRGQG